MHQFEKDVTFIQQGPSLFLGEVSDNWSVNGTPNGGYLMAIIADTMSRISDKKSTPIITANYLARSVPGPAELHLEVVSQSSQFNRIQAKLVQEGKERIRALGTFADEKIECSLERSETASPDLAQREQCIAIPAIPKYSIYQNMNVLLDPSSAGWMQQKLVNISEHKGWISFKEDRPHDMASVLFMADAFPPPVFASQGVAAWVPTIELSVNVRSIPSTKWLKCIFRTRHITCGLLEEDGELWDEHGTLVAVSRQIAQFRKLQLNK